MTLGNLNNSIGIAYLHLDQRKESREHFLKALGSVEDLNYTFQISKNTIAYTERLSLEIDLFWNLARNSYEEGDFESTIKYCEKNLLLHKKELETVNGRKYSEIKVKEMLNSTSLLIEAYVTLGEIKRQMKYF